MVIFIRSAPITPIIFQIWIFDSFKSPKVWLQSVYLLEKFLKNLGKKSDSLAWKKLTDNVKGTLVVLILISQGILILIYLILISQVE